MTFMNFGAGAGVALGMLQREAEGNYLFLGKSGLNKTAFAREQIRRNLQVEKLDFCPDYYEVAVAEKSIGVEDVTDIHPFLKTVAVGGDRKYCLIPQAHRLTPAASNALLKMIEESKDVVFVFTADRALMDTVMSRVRMIRCLPLSESDFFKAYPEADENLRRFVCGRGGFYEKIAGDKKLHAAVDRLVNGIDCMKKPEEFLEIFSQVKEKDPESFFELGTEFVSLALEYLSGQLMLRMIGAQCTLPYDRKQCMDLLDAVGDVRRRLEIGRCGKNEFFALTRKLAG